MKREIESLRDDAAGLEQLYRQTLAGSDDASAFKEAIAQCAEEHPDNVLYRAWVCRLEDQPDASGQVDAAGKQDQLRQWRIAIASSAGLGILYALFANGKPPAPVPGEAEPLFWIGWGPVTALGILFYLAVVDRTQHEPGGMEGRPWWPSLPAW